MKKYKIIPLFLVLALLLSACGGKVLGVRKVYGASRQFSRWEIGSAMQTVTRFFAREFDGCTMTRLEYDEEKTKKEADAWAEQYNASEAIVLLSDFRVDASGGDGSLNPDSTYRNYQWILTRTALGSWKLQTWGYG